VNLRFGGQLTALYVVATCGVMLASRNRVLVAFGVVNLPVVALLGWLMVSAFISLWCAWADVTSVAIDVYIRRAGTSLRVGTEPRRTPSTVDARRLGERVDRFPGSRQTRVNPWGNPFGGRSRSHRWL
jgi:hypothetical protein